ncbi:hypothetical protein ACIBF1_17230 [Spirillospora sp. NPDC050679]
MVTWATFVVGLVLAGLAVLMLRNGLRRPATAPVDLGPIEPAAFDPADMAEPDEPQRTSITDVLLESGRADYHFLFSATVLWRSTGAKDDTSVDMAALARAAVLERACEITRRSDPERVSFVQHELSAPLGRMEPETSGHLCAMATSVRLSLSPNDQRRLDQLAEVRKKKDVWEHERRHERNVREYLGEDVLKDTGSAVVWWLSKNEGEVEKAVDNIKLLARLASAAQNVEVPEQFQQHVPPFTDMPTAGSNGSAPFRSSANGRSASDHFDDFLKASGFAEDDPQRVWFAHQVGKMARTNGYSEMADDLESRFDAPESSEPPPDPIPGL